MANGELCDKKYLLITKYAERFGLPDLITCPPRQFENNGSSWYANTCCDLNNCPVVRGKSEEYLNNALSIYKRGTLLDENTIIIE